MSRADDIIDLLDNALQHSPEASYGADAVERCWRCLARDPADGSTSGLCDPCADAMRDPAIKLAPASTAGDLYEQLMARLSAPVRRNDNPLLAFGLLPGGGFLDLGIRRDSSLDTPNALSMFAEEFSHVAGGGCVVYLYRNGEEPELVVGIDPVNGYGYARRLPGGDLNPWRALGELARQWGQAVADALRHLFERLANWIGRVTEVADALDRPDPAPRFCPRHGQMAAGGQCRRCQREQTRRRNRW